MLYQIDEAVLLGNPPRPNAWTEVFEWLRFTNSLKRIPHNGLDEIQKPESYTPLDLNPVAKVLSKFHFEDGDAR